MQPKRLCLNMIVRNEMANIERCLGSIADHVGCWVIGDTGSTDGTQDCITAFFRERGIPGELHSFPFENFEQARNEALARAHASRLEFDYLLLADADMELVVEDRGFRARLAAPGYTVEQRAGISYWNTRLVARDVNAKYRGVTHEYLDARGAVRQLHGIWYKDHASGANRVDKFERDIALLQKGLEKEPENARYWFYLAQSYRDAGRHREAADAYAKRAEMGGWDEEAWYARLQEARCLRSLGDEGGFLRQALVAFNQRPHRAEPLYDLARYHRERGMNEAGVLFCEAGLALPRPEQDILFVEDYVYATGLREEYAIMAFYSRDPARKNRGFEMCNRLALDRDVPQTTRDLARSNLFYYVDRAETLLPSFTPQRVDFTPPAGYHPMNPSVARWGNEIVLVQRSVNFTAAGPPDGAPVSTRNFLLLLNDDLSTRSAGEILPPADWPEPKFGLVRGFEDLRLFARDDGLWCSATVRELAVEGWCEQVLARIDGAAPGPYRLCDWRVLHPVWPRQHEKNWMPQIANGRLRFLYSSDPTRVVDERGQPVSETTPGIAAENFRGGSQAIAFDGGWLAIVHEVLWRNSQRFYQHRFVWFDAANGLRRTSRPFVWRNKGIEYAVGLAWHPDGARMIVSFGVADAEAWIATVDAGDIRAVLADVAPLSQEPAKSGAGASEPTSRTSDAAPIEVRARSASTVRPQGNQGRPPVFLHASWRTGSTWFWGKFRELPETLCYYEPYHSANATVTRGQALRWNASSWPSGHPPLAPYWREYLPLIRKSGGIRLFDRAIPYAWFIPEGGLHGELRLAEKRYLALLLRHAERVGKTAVLGLNGSLGRVWAMKNTFGGVHIFQYRNLAAQWLSYLSYKADNNPVFYESTSFVINRDDDPFFVYLRDFFVNLARTNSNLAERSPIKLLLSLSVADMFSMFMAAHIYLYLHAALTADMAVDVTRMARDDRYRASMEGELAACSDLAVSFVDVREERHHGMCDLDPDLIDWDRIRLQAKFAAHHLSEFAPPDQLNLRAAEWVDATYAEMERSRASALTMMSS